VRWWSYYDPRWASVGLWKLNRLALAEVRPLRLDDPALIEASRTIARRIIENRRNSRYKRPRFPALLLGLVLVRAKRNVASD
jgi:hypothetical protein